MSVDSTIHVAKAELIDLDVWTDKHAQLRMSLHAAARGCTEITILVGYYNPSVLEELCLAVGDRSARRACLVRIAVGVEAVGATHRAWADMSRLAAKLNKDGFRRLEIGILPCSPTPFHTKLYRFVRHTRASWFVGSANASGSRHELMVKLRGKHDALRDYANAVMAKAAKVSGPQPHEEVATLRNLFLGGRLYYRPPAPRQFTYDAYRFSPEHRDRISDALAGAGQVVHASPKATGFVFVLRRALGLDEGQEDEVSSTASKSRHRPLSMETVFGHWTPEPYAQTMESKVASASARRGERLAALGAVLARPDGQAAARNGFEAYLSSMEAFLRENHIDCRPTSDAPAGFVRFLTATAKALDSPERRDRAARTLVLTDMPDIWSDERAREAFEDSFFDDLAYRTIAHRRDRIVAALVRAVGGSPAPSAPDDWREALEERLAIRAWQPDEWA